MVLLSKNTPSTASISVLEMGYYLQNHFDIFSDYCTESNEEKLNYLLVIHDAGFKRVGFGNITKTNFVFFKVPYEIEMKDYVNF